MRRDPRLLMQAALVAKDAGRLEAFHPTAFRARWAEAQDISDPGVVKRVLAGAGLDGDEALASAQSDELRERIDADSLAAVERGVFGGPTIFVGEEMFWGNDQFELVRRFVEKAQTAAASAAAGAS